MPRITVVIPCHNGEVFIRTAIDSVLAQGVNDLEVVVADDGSHDASVNLIKSYGPPVRLLAVKFGNTQATRNAAITNSDSEFVALLDQDDSWLNGKLQRQQEMLNAHPRIGLCYTDTHTVDINGQLLKDKQKILRVPKTQVEALGWLLRSNYIAASTVLLRRWAIEKVGLFNSDYHMAGDWEMWLRISESFEIAAVLEVLVNYCWHENNQSHNKVSMLLDTIAIQEAALRRINQHYYWGTNPELRRHLAAARKKLSYRYSDLGMLFSRKGSKIDALSNHAKACSLRPWTPRLWLRWARSLLCIANNSVGCQVR